MADPLRPAEAASIVLKISTLVIVVLLGVPQTLPNSYPSVKGGPYWTLLNVAQFVLLLVSSGLAISQGSSTSEAVRSFDFDSLPTLRATSDFVMALSIALLTILLWRRWRLCLPPSGCAAAILGLMSTACVLDVFRLCAAATQLQELTLSEHAFERESFVVSFILMLTVLGSFLLSEIQDLVIKDSKGHLEVPDDDMLSPLGRTSCRLMFPLLKDAHSKGATALARIPPLRRGLHSKNLGKAFAAKLAPRRTTPRRRSAFLVALAKVLWIDGLRALVVAAAYCVCEYSRIPALELLIDSEDGVRMTSATIMFAAATVCELLISCYQIDVLHVFGCRLRALLQVQIFNKVTTMSAGTKARYPSGSITSMLTIDCGLLSIFAFALPALIMGVLLFPLLFWMVATRAGVWPAVCAASWTLVVLCLPSFVSSTQSRLWGKAMKARDERLKATTDLLSTIRVVKMYAWEDALRENVLRLREVELKWLFRINLLDAILDCIYSSTSSVLMIILFSTIYVLEPDKVLTPALSFSCVSLLYMTDLTMNSCSQGLRNFNQGVLALRRIATFCAAEDQEEKMQDPTINLYTKKGAVAMEKCTFTWNDLDSQKSEPHLKDINLSVEPGSLIGIVGFVGSGKSSLLAAIMGDMRRVKGKVTCVGSVAFAPQLPCIHNMTIRDNILYGKPMDHAIYEKVIGSCQLTNDINKLQAGDMTEVGEKGTNLSGGQKQRISLARAVYSKSDIYLLDDPLTALDPVVAARVFRDVIGNHGMLRNKTRIVVCNQGHFLKHMDKLVLVDGKHIKVYDKLEDLVSDPDSPKNFREALEHGTSLHSNQTGTGFEDMEANDTIGRITQEEGGASTKTGWQLLRSLLRLSQWPAIVSVLAVAAGACAFALEQLSIKEWTDSSGTTDSDSDAVQKSWVDVLVALCVTDVGLRIVGSVLLSMSAQRLSRSLHNEMLDHVLRSPVSFFDASPQGRIVNRFSTDLDFVDARTFVSAKQSIQNTLLTVAKVAVIGTQSPVVLGVTAVLTVLTVYGMNAAVKASHCTRFYESVATSHMLQHSSETVDALSSVRTYGVTDRFRRHFYRLTDDTTRGLAAFGICYRFTRVTTSLAGFVVILCTLLANTVFAGPGGPDPSGVGLALSSAISVPLSMMTLCVMLFNVLQMIVSFERCVEYAELPPEDDVTSTRNNEEEKPAVGDVPTHWPSEGKVEFQNYSASYRPGLLPNVLSNVTFAVKPCEKIGVVGRTGAGKSSLVLALLRMLRASEGRILIDDVDIARVPLRKLRRSITVIPQDPSLVRGTLRMNLDPTNSHSDQELWQCLERAHLTTVVSNDPKGLLLETADGGSNLSVGQRQLVCLARALLRGTRILLLDEATSQMDGDTDQLIQVALRDAFAECTLFTIAHRLHTVLDYDRILVLEDGRVKEFDSIARLLSDESSTFFNMAAEAGINCARRRGLSSTYL